ncbi:MAG: hypothetical protein H7Z37_15400, partial [Pyrinomonadaceae bacterium]|nr:hypothetical protein [Pyrinomonadaceae bacterium]
MMNVRQNYEITKRDVRKNSVLILLARFAPILLAIPLPLIFIICYLVLGTTTAVAAFYLLLAFITFCIGFFVGVLLAITLYFYRESWLKSLRERIAADGIKTSEVEWFTRELTTNEFRALNELKKSNPLLGDAYQETLASRLTATRIVK